MEGVNISETGGCVFALSARRKLIVSIKCTFLAVAISRTGEHTSISDRVKVSEETIQVRGQRNGTRFRKFAENEQEEATSPFNP